MSETKIRAKFTVAKVSQNTHEGGFTQTVVVLNARYDPNLPEDKRFAEATPNGILEMTITNPKALEVFKAGKVFYLDFHEAPEGTSPYHG